MKYYISLEAEFQAEFRSYGIIRSCRDKSFKSKYFLHYLLMKKVISSANRTILRRQTTSTDNIYDLKTISKLKHIYKNK